MEYISEILANQSSRDTYLCIDTGEYISSRRLGNAYFISDEYKFVTKSENLFKEVLSHLPSRNTTTPPPEEFLVEEIIGGYITVDKKYILNKEFIAICRSDGTPLLPEDTEYLWTKGVTWESYIAKVSYDDLRIVTWLAYVNDISVPCSRCCECPRVGSAVLVDSMTRACPPTHPDQLTKETAWGVWECWHCHYDEVRVFD